MPISLGDSIGDLVLTRPDGTLLHLRDYLGRPVLLIFLRHLA
jgi:hypothetical protein